MAPGRMPDPQTALPTWVKVDETWLFVGGGKHPVAVVLVPQGRTAGSAPEWSGLDRARLPEAGPVRLGLWHLVVRWNDQVRSQRHPDIPASTTPGGLVWPPQAPSPPLRGPDGRRQGLKQPRQPACTEDAQDGLPPILTRLKQCLGPLWCCGSLLGSTTPQVN